MTTMPDPKVIKEPSFRESVDLMFNRAAALMDLPPGLEEKIRVCNSTYTVRFGVRLRGQIHAPSALLVGGSRLGGLAEADRH